MGETKDAAETVIILDREVPAVTGSAELTTTGSAEMTTDLAEATTDSAEGPQREVPPGEEGEPPAPAPGVLEGNAATEVLEPFVRAIEVLLRGLGDAVGEAGSAATVEMGSLVIEFSNSGWGDDTVRVSRHRRRAMDRSDDERTRRSDRPRGADDQGDPTASALPAGLPDFDEGDTSPGERKGDRWERGVTAAREGDHALALGLFEEEAERCAEAGMHHRAAIAFRSASREAGWVGRSDYANKLLRLAGKHYLFVGESPDTSVQGVVQAFTTAAKCFLQAGNLPLASASVTRALATSETLSAIA